MCRDHRRSAAAQPQAAVPRSIWPRGWSRIRRVYARAAFHGAHTASRKLAGRIYTGSQRQQYKRGLEGQYKERCAPVAIFVYIIRNASEQRGGYSHQPCLRAREHDDGDGQHGGDKQPEAFAALLYGRVGQHRRSETQKRAQQVRIAHRAEERSGVQTLRRRSSPRPPDTARAGLIRKAARLPPGSRE